MSLIKTVKKYGNSGGVYVPSEWIGGKVKLELVEEPIDLKKDILSRIPLEHVVSVIIYGSYVRKEMAKDSDIDIIIVTDGDPEHIDALRRHTPVDYEMGEKYDIQVMNANSLRNAVIHDPVLCKILKDEAVAIINHGFLDSIMEERPKASGIKVRLGLIQSSLAIVKEMLNAGIDAVDAVYPLVMRLKEILLIEYLLANKKYTTQALKQEITSQDISAKEFYMIMDIYRAARMDKNIHNYKISNDTITRLISLMEVKMQHVKQKALKKRN